MPREITTFKETQERFDPQTGEIYSSSTAKSVLLAKEKEDDYVKVYKYMSTVFAFKGIPLSLVPAVIEISKYMTYADKGQLVSMHKMMREQICADLGITINRLNQIVRELRCADILRATNTRGVYAVNPFIVGAGPVHKIHELRAQFDFEANLMRIEKHATNFITGETVKEAIIESKKPRKDQVQGQLTIAGLDMQVEEE